MLPASERLRSNSEFQQVYQEGRSFPEGVVVLYLLRMPDLTVRQAGFSVSKKLGNAVMRNVVKRRLREAYRQHLPALPHGYRAIFVARRSAAEADFAKVERSVKRALEKAGLLADMV